MTEQYKVVLVERWTFLNAQRNPVDGYRVSFMIPELGITDHVIIAEGAYNPDNVKAAIEEKLALHEALMS